MNLDSIVAQQNNHLGRQTVISVTEPKLKTLSVSPVELTSKHAAQSFKYP